MEADPTRKNATLRRIATAWRRLVSYMFRPEDGECLAVLRIAFGLLMMIDTMNERGFCRADSRWMKPAKCYFPLFDFIKPLPGRWMCLAYASMFSGVFGIFVGFHYRISCAMYAIPYWYIFLADKSSWNNHSYLFGLLIMIFSVTDAHKKWSIDRWLLQKIPSDASSSVPHWNYLLLRVQFFIMYFVAGLKKFDSDWLWGYSMMSLGHHHAFNTFRYVFSAEFVDHWIVHIGGFLVDLLSGFGLCFRLTRPLTFVILLIFHGMNSVMFSIGMFPYVCAAMLPVFCDPTTVSKVLRSAIGTTGYSRTDKSKSTSVDNESKSTSTDNESKSTSVNNESKSTSVDNESKSTSVDNESKSTSVDNESKSTSVDNESKSTSVNNDSKSTSAYDDIYKPPTRAKQNAIATCLCAYTALQLFLPYSHFITQGYNGLRNGLYGYSWDMMLYNIDVAKVQVKVVDHARREQFLLDPNIWTDNSKWALHGDMMRQFAGCVAANMPDRRDNMSIRMDVWGSLNGRFHQRLVDPTEDLLHAPWSPWSPTPWIFPLMRHLDRWRPWIVQVKNQSDDDLLFFADFPGMTVTNNADTSDTVTTTLAVLEGAVSVRDLGDDGDEGVRLVSGEAMNVTGRHAVTTVSATTSCYVYAASTASDDSISPTAGGHSPPTVRRHDDDDDRSVSWSVGNGGREHKKRVGTSSCSDACYAFVFDAIKYAFTALFR